MQAAIDRVMQTYDMMVNLTPAQEAEAREKVSNFLKDKGGDEHNLAVEGLKYLLGHVTSPDDNQLTSAPRPVAAAAHRASKAWLPALKATRSGSRRTQMSR
jgi:hypothetical protein